MPLGEVASGQRAVYRRLKSSYSPTYLTILSVVQAVAMGDLAQVVAAELSPLHPRAMGPHVQHLWRADHHLECL